MFVPEVDKFLENNNVPLNALLILDNAPSHPSADDLVKKTKDGKIWTLYMPPNVTPLIQPMDQNAIRITKLHYRNSLLSKILSSETNNIVDFLRNLNLYDAVQMIDFAWKAVKQECLANCWNIILNQNNVKFGEEDDIPLSRLAHHDEVECMRRGLGLINTVFPSVAFNIDDINNWNMDIIEENNFEDVAIEDVYQLAEELNSEETKIKHSDAIKGLEICMMWCQQNNIEHSKSLVLRELQEEAVQKSLQSVTKQSSITDFFGHF